MLDATHPVTQGLTSASLSNWHSSAHNNFTTPEAAAFLTLALDIENGGAVIIVSGTAARSAAPAASASALVALMLALLGTGIYGLRRAARFSA